MTATTKQVIRQETRVTENIAANMMRHSVLWSEFAFEVVRSLYSGCPPIRTRGRLRSNSIVLGQRSCSSPRSWSGVSS